MRDELLNETLFLGLNHAKEKIALWTNDFNTSRPHSALGYLTPAAHAANLTATGGRRRNPDHMWTPLWQELFRRFCKSVGCSHMSGLSMQSSLWTAGLDVFRGSDPYQLFALSALVRPGSSNPRNDRVASTSFALPNSVDQIAIGPFGSIMTA